MKICYTALAYNFGIPEEMFVPVKIANIWLELSSNLNLQSWMIQTIHKTKFYIQKKVKSKSYIKLASMPCATIWDAIALKSINTSEVYLHLEWLQKNPS